MGSVALFVPHVGCPQQCSFCDQRAITGGAQPPEPWQVWQAAQAAASHLGQRVKETEIAFFGGSFTAIPRGQMLALLAPAKEAVERFGFRGLRCSTRPDAIDGEVLSLLKAYHMVAVELGAQSMDGEVLRRKPPGPQPRGHRPGGGAHPRRGAGAGLADDDRPVRLHPGEGVETARALIALQPATARVYPTVVLEGTHLAALYRQGATITPQTLEEAVAPVRPGCWPLFEEAGGAVIRVGLHAQAGCGCAGRVAGPYHPAFRELVESRRFLSRLLPELERRGPGAYQVRVCPRQLSAATGQRRANVEALAQRGYRVRFAPDRELPFGGFLLERQETRNEKGKLAQ